MGKGIAYQSAKILQRAFANLGLGVMRNEELEILKSEYFSLREAANAEQHAARDLRFLLEMPSQQGQQLLRHFPNSRAEFRQDLFVLTEVDFKREGYFVEFGATDGYSGSNTHLLERDFDWNGILVEPARVWHERLCRARNAIIDTRCVWSDSGQTVKFNETVLAGFSTIDNYTNSDYHSESRSKGIKYDVETVSLNDLLDYHGAPSQIDYLSLDTEGSEFDILGALDFSIYSFNCITVEHNHSSIRDDIHQLLTKNGYKRKYEEISMVDDWYVRW